MGWETTYSVMVNAPRAAVWAFHSDVGNWALVEGEAVESITLDGPFQAGTVGTTKLANRDPVHWRLVAVEPPERTVIEMDVTEAVVRVVWTFEALPGEQTRMTQQMLLEGPGAGALAPVMEEQFAGNLGAGMERVAEAMARYAAGSKGNFRPG